MKFKLVEDWRQAHKFASMQIAGGGALLFGIGPEFLKIGTQLLNTWVSIPDDLKSALPQGTARVIAVSALVLVMLGRVLRRDGGAE